MKIEVTGPNLEQKQLFKNMWTFYLYDLLPFQSDGTDINNYGVISDDESHTHSESVERLDIGWESPESLFPLIVEVDGKAAGFVMITTRPIAHPDVDYRIHDFFILNKYRKKGVGEKAVSILLNRFSGTWELGWLEDNVAAGKFWNKVINANARDVKDWNYSESEEVCLPGLYFKTG